VLVLVAVADEFDKMWMPQLPKENNFSLSSPVQSSPAKTSKSSQLVVASQHKHHFLSILRNILTTNTWKEELFDQISSVSLVVDKLTRYIHLQGTKQRILKGNCVSEEGRRHRDFQK